MGVAQIALVRGLVVIMQDVICCSLITMHVLKISSCFKVHGFTSVEYYTNESVLALVQEFRMFVKGETLGVQPILSGLPGSIGSVAVTARGKCM